MKKFGKVISLLLAVVLLACAIPMSALADSANSQASSLPLPSSTPGKPPEGPPEKENQAQEVQSESPKPEGTPLPTTTPNVMATPGATATPKVTAKPEEAASPPPEGEEAKAEQRFTELLEQYGGYLDENGKLRSSDGREAIDKPLAEIYEEAGFPQISLYAGNMTIIESSSGYIQNIGFRTNVEGVNGWGTKLVKETGKVAYCVEHGVSLSLGNNGGYTEKNFTKEQLDKLSLIDYWGRYKNIAGIQGTDKAMDEDWNYITVSADTMAQFYCQLLVWETIDSWGGDFVGASSVSIPATIGGEDNIASQSTYDKFKAAVTAKVDQFYTTPSISGQTVKLKMGETKTIKDTTGALASYKNKPIFNNTGITITKSGSTVTLKATGTPKAKGVVRFGYDVATAYYSQGAGFYYQHATTQNVATCGFSGADPAAITLNVEVELNGSVKIVKTSEDGVISGLKFKISGNGVNKTVTTGANGTISVPNLKPGTYTIAEVSTPGRYTQPKSQTVTVSANKTATVNFKNVLKKGSLRVQKASEDGAVSGRTFRINSNYAGYGTAQWDITTDTSGIATLKNLPIYDKSQKLIKYTVAETKVPIRYTSPSGQTVTINSSPTTPFNNLLKKASIKIIKTAEDGKIEGKTFELKSNYSGYGKDTWLLTTDKNGVASVSGLPVYDKDGKKIIYTVKETNVTVEYVKPGAQKSTLTENINKSFTFANNLKKGSLSVKKTSQDKETQGRTFRVKADFGYNGKDTWDIKTDKTGAAKLTGLPLYNKKGKLIKYTVEETDVPIRYITPDKQTVTVDKTPQLPFNNKLKEGIIRVVKESEDGIIKGVKFTIKSSYSGYGQDTWEVITGDDGTAIVKGLPMYDKEGKEIKYTVTETGTELRYIDPDGQETTLQQGLEAALTFKNLLKKGLIRISKESEDGEVTGMKFKLSGNGKEFTGVTDDKGQLVFKDLDIYDINNEKIVYTLLEYDVPVRYIQPEEQKVTLTDPYTENSTSKDRQSSFPKAVTNTAPGQPITLSAGSSGAFLASVTAVPHPAPDIEKLFSGYEINFKNSIKKGVVTVTKVSADNSDEKLSGAVFTVYADKDGNGKYNAEIDLKQSSLKEVKKGTYQSDKLVFGKYLLVEETAPQGFSPDSKYYGFEIKEDNEAVVIGNKGTLFVNSPVKESPKTGDTNSHGLWVVLLALSAVGLTAIVILKFKKRKR